MWFKTVYVFCIMIVAEIFILIIYRSSVFNRLPDDKFTFWYNTSRDLKLYLKPNSSTFIQKPSRAMEPTDLLIMVCSATNNFNQRTAIRSTWGNMDKLNFSKFFEIVQKKNLHKYMVMEPDAPYPKFRLGSVKRYYEYLLMSSRRDEVDETFLTSNFSRNWNQGVKVRVLFVLGLPNGNESLQNEILAENMQYGDIIQEDFIDSFKNLSIKVGMMLKWISNNCRNKTKFILKSDDDVYLNLYKLLYKLNYFQEPSKLLMGSRFRGMKPVKNGRSKYYTPRYMYNSTVFPNYLSGPLYLMTPETALALYETALNTPLFNLEDIYYTGICANLAQIPVVHSKVFLSYEDLMFHCPFSYYIGTHNLKAPYIYKLSEMCDLSKIDEELIN